jgi:hypothetical protein
MKLKTGDIIIILASLCFIVLFSVYIFSNPRNSQNLHILTPEKEYIYSLQTDRQIEIDGPLGTSTIEIKDGHAFMSSSPCPLKICIERGEISGQGEWIACLPNKILLIIKGKENEEPEIDSISQ